MAINFTPIGSFNSIVGGSKILDNPTSLQFGPDGRLYVSQQNRPIEAFTVAFQNGEYVATERETLRLANGSAAVQSIQNHDDDGALNSQSDRQTTGILVTGTAQNPVLYVSSSDPRLPTRGDSNDLDTNSGVITRLTWTGEAWEAVDIVRGLPRSEEAHSVNGLVLSPDGTKLYVTVGGNTNNGAASQFFAYANEYALSGTVLEIDLADIASRPVLTDNAPGQGGRQYVYDLPTLDDPTVANITDGVGEDAFGMDEAGPWGGNDGFNMAILPADAPLRIYADGFRNAYDLVMARNGNLYTVDNGSNARVGGDIIYVDGKPTSLPNDGGDRDDVEPLFRVEDGGYYGHPNPARANQNLAWTVYDNNGNPDGSVSPNSTNNIADVSGLADLVPDSVNIAEGFLIDPSKFTGDANRLAQSGVRVPRTSGGTNAIANNLGSSSNGLVEYAGGAFGGILDGKLITTQFNGNVALLNVNAAGSDLAPVVDPADGSIIGNDGVLSLITAQSLPLDVTVGPNGTLWVAEFGPDNINVFAPSDDSPTITNADFDGDGINNVFDPFIRDETNGQLALLRPDKTLTWDFDPDQDNNLPGPDGYATGLTGVAIDGITDFEAFLQSPSPNPGQLTRLDNVKFATASGGGSTLIEVVSNGDPLEGSNTGEYLFQTGVNLAATVEAFTIKWAAINPAEQMTEPLQQLGGYIGTGDQSNYLKIVATRNPAGDIQVLLEDDDRVQSNSFIQADDLFTVPNASTKKISFELMVDVVAETATPMVVYETEGGVERVGDRAISLSGTQVLEAIKGNYTVQGQPSGLAVGLFSSSPGSPAGTETFSAIFDDIEITAVRDRPSAYSRETYPGTLSSNTDGSANPNDFIVGTAGDDNIWAGLQGNDVVNGGAGDDLIGVNSSGNTDVEAGAGNDTVYQFGSGSGNHYSNLGSGNDSFWSEGSGRVTITGSGNNTIGLADGDYTLLTAGGNDVVYSTDGTTGEGRLNLGDGDNSVLLERGRYDVTTGSGNDTIGLAEGPSFIRAGDGDNVVYSAAPAETDSGAKDVITGTGNDYVQTGAGDDLIDGGSGFNWLYGGSGSDTFTLSADAYSFLGDFELGVDRIALADVSFDELSFYQGSATSDSAANTFIFVNGTGFVEVVNTTVAGLNNASNFV